MITRFRMWLAFLLIGRQPAIANVELGGREGFIVTARGGRLWSNAHILMRPMTHFYACTRITQGVPWRRGDPVPGE